MTMEDSELFQKLYLELVSVCVYEGRRLQMSRIGPLSLGLEIQVVVRGPTVVLGT